MKHSLLCYCQVPPPPLHSLLSPITRHSPPPTPPCLHALHHLSCALDGGLRCINSSTSAPCMFSFIPISFSFTPVSSSAHTSTCQTLFHLLPTDHDVVSITKQGAAPDPTPTWTHLTRLLYHTLTFCMLVHPIICFLQIHNDTVKLPLSFSILLHQHLQSKQHF